MFNTHPPSVTVAEAVKYLLPMNTDGRPISQRTIKVMIRLGKFPNVFKAGGINWIPISDIESINQQRRQAIKERENE